MKSLLAQFARWFWKRSNHAIRAGAGWPDQYNRIAIPLALLAASAPAFAQNTPPAKSPLSVAQCLSLLVALRTLDGHVIVIKQNGQEATVMVPWDFGSGALRMKIGTSITALAGFETTLETTRQNIVKEILKKMPADADGKPATEIKAGTPEFAEYQRQYGEALAAPCDVKLPKIKASEMHLERNEIPVTALSALSSVIDDDISGARP